MFAVSKKLTPFVEGGVHKRARGVLVEAAAEGRPRAEADLRDLEIAVAERPVPHYDSVSIWARCSRPE